LDYLEEEIKKKLKYNLQEQEIIKKMNIKPEIFLPLIFSLKFGGNWSYKTEKDNVRLMAIKDKVTKYDPQEKVGYTMETIYLFSNPVVIREEGGVLRLEKCSEKQEREIVERPYIVEVDADDIIKAVLHPGKLKIKVEHITGSLTLEGSLAYGVSHEMDHLMGQDEEHPKFLWDFNYELL
jgi:predicted metalloprotease